MKKTWAILNYLWYLWAISSCLLRMLNIHLCLWQLFSSKFWIGLDLVPCYCGPSQSCDMQLTVLPSCRAYSPSGKMEEELCSVCHYSPLLAAQPYLLLLWKPTPPPVPYFLWKSENNVVLCFTRQKINAWFSLVSSISPMTASCSVGTDSSSSVIPLYLFWY